MATATLEAIRYSRGKLLVLDQLRLPHEYHYDEVSTAEEAFDCIRSMRVRGAPAIAMVAALAHAVELFRGSCETTTAEDTISYVDSRLDYLQTSRPTAVDLANAVTLLKKTIREARTDGPGGHVVVTRYIQAAEAMLEKDIRTNRSIGGHGARWLQEQQRQQRQQQHGSSGEPMLSVLTHCNTGSLATSGHGTALGIVRTLHSRGLLRHVYCTETRPYNQGGRLTATELAYEGIPATLVTDSMAGALMAGGGVDAVVVGADRVVRNGDTANKIGTYTLAVLARHHGLSFVVAAPTTSIDLGTATGADVEVEQRRPEELTQITGAVVDADGTVTARMERVAIAHGGIAVWNPAFDVTPHDLVDAVVTEKGVVSKGVDGKFDFGRLMHEPETAGDTTGDTTADTATGTAAGTVAGDSRVR